MLKAGFLKIAEGDYCEVWLSKKAFKIVKSAPPKDRGRTNDILGHLSDNGPNDLNEQKFKSEARFPNAEGTEVMVYATKSYQLRVYGCWESGPRLRFVASEAAIKKDNKADRAQLKRAAKSVGE
ncbi:hypothetical protein [Ascidiaceihabitans donghaensis]|uniref:hypothetical protein n=1 Tax=Ascidiaceihabitans donghaensis TaxID=1510460 RepID=UPI000D551D38|nr:hypothetical protein [Ascidiaceihabitans donghaensis]